MASYRKLAVLVTNSVEETETAGIALGAILARGDVVLLQGELGAGKTAFSRGVARGLGVTDRVTSPTFVLVRSYHGTIDLVHADLYRIQEGSYFDLEMLELVPGDAVTLIEWGDRAAGFYEASCPLVVEFLPGPKADTRVINFEGDDQTWARRLSEAGLRSVELD